ncbi:hypothetical protein CSUB01_12224 [Colletotrichum sublineola]|uniref:Uncharacterized protein n=1 Tax=Colletotrichum sublineola TaxID=1173701 RepID=A0A066XSW9_COLSU|nr:hypothetical protein CSUB01_12224 [Colletotrichum sublineola]
MVLPLAAVFPVLLLVMVARLGPQPGAVRTVPVYERPKDHAPAPLRLHKALDPLPVQLADVAGERVLVRPPLSVDEDHGLHRLALSLAPPARLLREVDEPVRRFGVEYGHNAADVDPRPKPCRGRAPPALRLPLRPRVDLGPVVHHPLLPRRHEEPESPDLVDDGRRDRREPPRHDRLHPVSDVTPHRTGLEDVGVLGQHEAPEPRLHPDRKDRVALVHEDALQHPARLEAFSVRQELGELGMLGADEYERRHPFPLPPARHRLQLPRQDVPAGLPFPVDEVVEEGHKRHDYDADPAVHPLYCRQLEEHAFPRPRRQHHDEDVALPRRPLSLLYDRGGLKEGVPQLADLAEVSHHLRLQLVGELHVEGVVPSRRDACVGRLQVLYELEPGLPPHLACQQVVYRPATGPGPGPVVLLCHVDLHLPHDEAADLPPELDSYVPVARHRKRDPNGRRRRLVELLAEDGRVPQAPATVLPEPRVERRRGALYADLGLEEPLERHHPGNVRHHHLADGLGQETGHLPAEAPDRPVLVPVGDEHHLPVEDENVLRHVLRVAVPHRRHLRPAPGLAAPDVDRGQQRPLEGLRPGQPPEHAVPPPLLQPRVPQAATAQLRQPPRPRPQPLVLLVRREGLPRPFEDERVDDVAKRQPPARLGPAPAHERLERRPRLRPGPLRRPPELVDGHALPEVPQRLPAALPHQPRRAALLAPVALAVRHHADDGAKGRARPVGKPAPVPFREVLHDRRVDLVRVPVDQLRLEEVFQQEDAPAPHQPGELLGELGRQAPTQPAVRRTAGRAAAALGWVQDAEDGGEVDERVGEGFDGHLLLKG